MDNIRPTKEPGISHNIQCRPAACGHRQATIDHSNGERGGRGQRGETAEKKKKEDEKTG
jgi:hypothetical protein